MIATTANANIKYRLPNGALFIRSHAPVARVAINEYKMLLRLLKGEMPSPGLPR